jgi:Ras-related GTP-binding protein A/B
MGKSGSGKTSMRSIIFANYIARDTRRLGATIDVEHSHVRFLGNLVLNLWDCGGQEAFMENYFASQRDHIFRNVEVLIYVFDVESREFFTKDMQYYMNCVEALLQHSRDAKVFCLLHKMDLVPDGERDQMFMEREQVLKQRSVPMAVTCFGTSIWDETLYRAWYSAVIILLITVLLLLLLEVSSLHLLLLILSMTSTFSYLCFLLLNFLNFSCRSSIVYALIPNIQVLEQNLQNFCELCEADEVVLFERATFLVISHSTTKPHNDVHRFEKISNIIKQFKLSCR